jgi:hypothetical protein
MSTPPSQFVLLWLTAHGLLAVPVQAELFSLSESGTISKSNTADTALPRGIPWTYDIIYDTAAPNLDFELTGRPDSSFGRFTNTGAIPALKFFHYRATNDEVIVGLLLRRRPRSSGL